MAAIKSPKKKPARTLPDGSRLEALEGTVEELTEVIRALMRDSVAATKQLASHELRLRALERKGSGRR